MKPTHNSQNENKSSHSRNSRESLQNTVHGTLLTVLALAGSIIVTSQAADAQQRWSANNQTRRLPSVVRSSFVQSSYAPAQSFVRQAAYVPTRASSFAANRSSSFAANRSASTVSTRSSSYPTQTVSNSTGGRRVASSVAPVLRSNLPPVRLDSFVLEAKGHAEHIYGDEGADGLPPYFGFSHPHRINTGITDGRDAGLTTGHGSHMPEAWGADEFIAPPGEWSNSGANGGNFGYNNAAAGLDARAAEQRAAAQSGGGGAGSLTPEQLAAHPSPGEGYQPMFQHGRFVGWWSPSEIALSQTDFKAALRSIIRSDRFWGDALSIEIEIGDRPMSDLYGALGF